MKNKAKYKLNDMKLFSFSFQEEQPNGSIEVEYSPVVLNGFNLFIGDNAQGKTRLFNTFQFIKSLLTLNRKQISTAFTANFEFHLENDDSLSKINYELKITSSNEGNNYLEKILKDGNLILSTIDKKAFNEKTKRYLDNFFIPKNIPAIASIDDPSFITIKFIREFFLRMLFIDSKQINEVMLDKNAKILNPMCTNLSSVLLNWQKDNPQSFLELVEDFKRCFSNIDDIKFVSQPVIFGGVGVQADLLALHEKGLKKEIALPDWSNGMFRLLSILCLPKTQFIFNDEIFYPSIIFIDEIENGLDFKTLGFVVKYLNDYSDIMQIIMSSHSPSISEFVHPKNWQVVKRKGSKIKITKPSDVEPHLDEELELFRRKYWDFYTKHVSHSNLYEPE
ncbi:MAG: AAA family ATPase [Gammaproteobacteria bacterium]